MPPSLLLTTSSLQLGLRDLLRPLLLLAIMLAAGCCTHPLGQCGTACGDHHLAEPHIAGVPLLDEPAGCQCGDAGNSAASRSLAGPCRSCGRVHEQGPACGVSSHAALAGECIATDVHSSCPVEAPLWWCREQPDCLRPEYLLGFGWPHEVAPVPPPPIRSAAFTNELPTVKFLPVPARSVF